MTKWIFIVGGGLIAIGLIVWGIYASLNARPTQFGNLKNNDANYG